MNFAVRARRLKSGRSIMLMSRRANAPYTDSIIEDGTVLIYEGHDVPTSPDNPIPKLVDQPEHSPSGALT